VNSTKALSIVTAILGLLLTCCLCPLAVNILVWIATSDGERISLYGRIFSAPIGDYAASLYVAAFQYTCSTSLALIVLLLGIVMFILAMRSSK
jgi:hypothetical protein